MTKPFLSIILFCLWTIVWQPAFAKASPSVLKQMQEALQNVVNYKYDKPEKWSRAFSGYPHLPETVNKYMYWKDRARYVPLRIDYYAPAGLFSRERYIITELFLYDMYDKLKFTVWMNLDREIRFFIRYEPIRTIKKDGKTGLEILQENEVYYDQNGNLTKQDQWIYTLHHNERKATYLRTVVDANNSIILRESGDWDYADLTKGPQGHSK